MAFNYLGRVRFSAVGWPGSPSLNTFYFAWPTDNQLLLAEDALECATRVRNALNSGFKQLMPTLWVATVSPVVDVLRASDGDLVESFSVAPPATVAGTTSATFGPAASGLALNQLTSDVVNGHRVRGRAYFSPIAPVADADGTPTATQVSQCNTFGVTLKDASPEFLKWVVWHRPKAGVGGSGHLITSINTRDRFAIMRSRRAA